VYEDVMTINGMVFMLYVCFNKETGTL